MSVQTELHRHLDASFRTRTLLELAQTRGIEPRSTSLEAFKEKFVLTKPQLDLKTVLSCFTLFQKVLDRPETLERLAYETVEDCFQEGTRKVELRFSPGFVAEFSKLKWIDVLDSFDRGVKRAQKMYPDIRVGYLCIASRELGVDSVAQTAEFYATHRARFVGMDLAGPEDGYPCRNFESAFKPLRVLQARGEAHITIHAGEASGPDNVWEAIELLGAERIGHGIASIKDSKLIETLKGRKICLEICPTSNWITQSVKALKAHPLKEFLKLGVPVSINTDDPGIFGSSLLDEYRVCREKIGLAPAEITRCIDYADQASFIRSI